MKHGDNEGGNGGGDRWVDLTASKSTWTVVISKWWERVEDVYIDQPLLCAAANR